MSSTLLVNTIRLKLLTCDSLSFVSQRILRSLCWKSSRNVMIPSRLPPNISLAVLETTCPLIKELAIFRDGSSASFLFHNTSEICILLHIQPIQLLVHITEYTVHTLYSSTLNSLAGTKNTFFGNKHKISSSNSPSSLCQIKQNTHMDSIGSIPLPHRLYPFL